MTAASRARALTLASLLSSAAVVPSVANVVDVASNGFTVQVAAHIAAPTDKVYSVLITPAHWWSSDHTFSHDAANLTLDATAGGCWCEKLPAGGSASHLTVVYVDPGKVLRLRGALGPFQAYAVDGAMTWSLKSGAGAGAGAGGTDLSLTYTLGGYAKDGFETWSKAADGVLAEQVARLKRLIEAGAPDK